MGGENLKFMVKNLSDYEQANREARDLICELNGREVRNYHVFLEVYIIGIDASIKQGIGILH
jgi:hypothetical protein